jgi:hypothetical protein
MADANGRGLRRPGRWPLAHLPSGSFPANAAWLACAAISHFLLRAAGSLASLTYAKARGATLRRDLISVAARIARHGRGHITVHRPRPALRDRMDDPVRRHLRAARRGLTSSDPVTARLAACTGHLATPNPRHEPHGQAAEKVSGG